MIQTNKTFKKYIIIGLIIVLFFLFLQSIPMILDKYFHKHMYRLVENKELNQTQKETLLDFFDFHVEDNSKFILTRYTYGKDPVLLVWIAVEEKEEELIKKNEQYEMKFQDVHVPETNMKENEEHNTGNRYYNEQIGAYLGVYQEENTTIACLYSYGNCWETAQEIFKELSE